MNGEAYIETFNPSKTKQHATGRATRDRFSARTVGKQDTRRSGDRERGRNEEKLLNTPELDARSETRVRKLHKTSKLCTRKPPPQVKVSFSIPIVEFMLSPCTQTFDTKAEKYRIEIEIAKGERVRHRKPLSSLTLYVFA